jgi:hypothetical protein
MNLFSQKRSHIQTLVIFRYGIFVDIDYFSFNNVKILFLYRNANEMILHFSGKVSINEVVRLKTSLIELLFGLHQNLIKKDIILINIEL